MHDTAMLHGKMFFQTYFPSGKNIIIGDIGAQDINGSLRDVRPEGSDYVGVDFQKGKGVDVLIEDPYVMPFPDNHFDAVVCSSCLEHSEFFWLVFLELNRIVKPNGLIFLNVPSNGEFHRTPVDCWRFYPDSGVALQNWAVRSGYKTALLESFIGKQKSDIWNDFIAVFVKDRDFAVQYPQRMIDNFKNYFNGLRLNNAQFARFETGSQDQKIPGPRRAFRIAMSTARRRAAKMLGKKAAINEGVLMDFK